MDEVERIANVTATPPLEVLQLATGIHIRYVEQTGTSSTSSSSVSSSSVSSISSMICQQVAVECDNGQLAVVWFHYPYNSEFFFSAQGCPTGGSSSSGDSSSSGMGLKKRVESAPMRMTSSSSARNYKIQPVPSGSDCCCTQSSSSSSGLFQTCCPTGGSVFHQNGTVTFGLSTNAGCTCLDGQVVPISWISTNNANQFGCPPNTGQWIGSLACGSDFFDLVFYCNCSLFGGGGTWSFVITCRSSGFSVSMSANTANCLTRTFVFSLNNEFACGACQPVGGGSLPFTVRV